MFKAFSWKHFSIILYGKSQTVPIISWGECTKRHFKISFSRKNEAIKHDLVEFKLQCLKIFCYHGNKSTILLFYSIFRTPEVFIKLYFVEIC